jgi:hypothetical protein
MQLPAVLFDRPDTRPTTGESPMIAHSLQPRLRREWANDTMPMPTKKESPARTDGLPSG